MTENVTDKEIFESALAPEVSVAPVTQEAVVTETTEAKEQRNRDEKGQFVAKAAKPEASTPEIVAEPVEKPDTKDEANVPSWRVREINEEKRAALEENKKLLQRLAALERTQTPATQTHDKKEPLMPWDDGFVDEIEGKIDARTQRINLRLDWNEAVAEYGKDIVKAADKAIQERVDAGEAHLAEQFKRAPNPFVALVEWHKREQVIAKVGTDPDAYVNAEIEKRLSDPAEQAKYLERIRGQTSGANRPAPVTSIPPSLKNLPSGGNNATEEDTSDAAMFNYAVNSRR